VPRFVGEQIRMQKHSKRQDREKGRAKEATTARHPIGPGRELHSGEKKRKSGPGEHTSCGPLGKRIPLGVFGEEKGRRQTKGRDPGRDGFSPCRRTPSKSKRVRERKLHIGKNESRLL